MLIRSAQPGDALAVASVHVRAWQTGYQSLLPKDYLDGLKPEDRADRYDFANADPAKPKTFVAIENEVIAGFVTLAPATDNDVTGFGALSALYVTPERWGHGIGAQLISHAHRQFLVSGYGNALLWVLAGNQRAERFYRYHGWVADGSHRRDTVWGISIDEARYRRRL